MKKLKTIFSTLRRAKPFRRISYFLAYLIPRRDNLWVFGGCHGERFADNPKYMFLEVCKNNSDINPVWITKNDDLLEELNNKNLPVQKHNSIKGIYYNLRASKLFVSHGISDVNKWCCGGIKKINLWHGAALKKILSDETKWQNASFLEKLQIKIRYKLYFNFHYILASGKEQRKIFTSAFKQKEDDIIPYGFPRNDILIQDSETDLSLDIPNAEKIIIYLPTWRRFQSNDNLDFKSLNKILSEKNYILLIKAHQHGTIISEDKYSHIISLKKTEDIQPILRETDALITDYSSVYFDYLHLDKPIIFFPYDLEKYRKERGLYYEYEDITPGPKAYNQGELHNAIKNIDKQDYSQQRQEVKKKIFDHYDGKASERITQYFTSNPKDQDG